MQAGELGEYAGPVPDAVTIWPLEDGCKPGSKWRARLSVRTRADELPLLQELRALTGVGSLYRYRPPDVNPVAVWCVHAWNDVRCVVSLLDEAPLRGRKATEYDAWRRLAVTPLDSSSYAGLEAYSRLKELRHI